MFVLTFSPLGEKVNTNMALIHRQVKKSTLGKIVNNYRILGLVTRLHPFTLFYKVGRSSMLFIDIICH